MKRVAIIGGGISGLSAAYALEQHRRAGGQIEYSLFESSSRLGGVLVTDRVDGCLIEAGPDSFLTEKPWAADLCRQIGIGDQLIGSNDAQRKTYILVNGRLVVMPDGLMFMVPTKILPTVFSPLFSFGTKFRMAREWFHPPHKAEQDESVAAMVERHYGPEMVDRLADPLLSGVYGGEASQLSVRAVLSRFAEMEAKHGSLGRAMLAARKKMAVATHRRTPLVHFASQRHAADGRRSGGPAVASLATEWRTCQCSGRRADGWVVSADRNATTLMPSSSPLQLSCGRVAAAMTSSAKLSRELGEIRYSSSVTVTLGYDREGARFAAAGLRFPRAAQ